MPESLLDILSQAGSLLPARIFHQLCRLELFYASWGKESNG